jgi:DNA-binding LytR/AlgR family response regulator
MINCLIVDDEPIARQVLKTHLSFFPNWHLVKECTKAAEAYEQLHYSPVEVMFLDIQMPFINGTDFLRSLKNPPLVVFTTAYSHYAVEGFELMAVDYLLKPITFDRFKQALFKVQEKLGMPIVFVQEKTVPALQTDADSADYLFLKQDYKLVKVRFDEILYLEAQRDFTKVYLKDRILLASLHLKMMDDLLPSTRFVRTHRSYTVALAAVTALYGNMLEIGLHKIPIGGNYKDDVVAALKL